MPSSLFSPRTQQPVIQPIQADPRILQMYQVLKTSSNPNAMMQNLMVSNPNMAQVMNLVNMFGGDPKEAFYKEAQRRGVDPNSILKMFN